jgi:hypothetical protein
VFCSDGTVAGMGCKTLACASEVQVQCEFCRLAANGALVGAVTVSLADVARDGAVFAPSERFFYKF